MKNAFWLPVTALAVTALFGPVRLANAQPACSGVGMTLLDVAQKRWGRARIDPADFPTWNLAGTNQNKAFVSPGAAWVLQDQLFVIDNKSNLLQFTLINGKLVGAPRYTAPSPTLSVVTSDGVFLYIVDGYEIRTISPKTDLTRFTLPSVGKAHDIAFDGRYIWILMENGDLVRAIYDTSGVKTGKMTFQTTKAAQRSSRSGKLAFDGRYLWVAYDAGVLYKLEGLTLAGQYQIAYAGEPRSLTFDGYAMWLTESASNTIHRFRAHDGSPLSSLSLGSPRGVAFDGTYMLVTDRANAQLAGYLACNALAAPPYTVPGSPEYVSFDGANYWVTSTVSKTVSVR
jgi:hypothetical protein